MAHRRRAAHVSPHPLSDRRGSFRIGAGYAPPILTVEKREQPLGEIISTIDIGFRPEAAVSGAILLQDEDRTFLVFNISPADRGRDGWNPRAILTFKRCIITKFGYPNDEANMRVSGYAVSEVFGSEWIAEIRANNRISFPDHDMGPLRHLIFSFHDSTLECITEGYTLETSAEPLDTILARLTACLYGG